MFHHLFRAAAVSALVVGLLTTAAEADHRAKFRKYHDYDAESENFYLPRHLRYFFASPEDYEDEFADDQVDNSSRDRFDEDYYDPTFEEPKAKLKPAPRKPVVAKSLPKAPSGRMASVQQPELNSAPKPAEKKPVAAAPAGKSAAGSLSCDKATGIVGSFGFTAVKVADCQGQVYAFNATRDGKSFTIKLNAKSGELTEVKKVP